MQPDRLGGADEPDRAVQARVIRDGQAGQAQLHGPLDQVVGRGRAIEEREVRVAVELGVRGGCHGVAPVLTGWLGAVQYRTDVLSNATPRSAGPR